MATGENPWDITSIYELLFFNCPSCNFKVNSKQKQNFVNHAYETHPESVYCLSDIQDGSISDIILPWQDVKREINDNENSKKSMQHESSESMLDSAIPKNYCQLCCKLFASKKSYVLHQHNELHLEDEPTSQPNIKDEDDDHLISENIAEVKSEIKPEKSIIKYKFIEVPLKKKKTTGPKPKPLNRKPEILGPSDLKKPKRKKFEAKVPLSAVGSIPKPIPPPRKPIEKKESICEQCGRVFNNKYLMNSHIRKIHENIRNFPCPHCPKRFRASIPLREHVNNVHLNIKAYQCDHCGSTFRNRGQLKEHLQIIHEGVPRETFKCDSCDKTYLKKKSLEFHIERDHKGVGQFMCNVCNLICRNRTSLKQHMDAVHEKIKRFSCDQCDSKFTTPFNLKEHVVNVHEGKLQFQCQHCQKGFKRRNLLNKHIVNEHSANINKQD